MSREQKRLGDQLVGKTIRNLEFREKWDDGTRCTDPEIYNIHFTDGSYLELEGSIKGDLID